MSDRAIVRILSWLAVSMAGGIIWGQSVTVTTAPGNINLTYLQGAALPSAQSISVKASAAGATYTASVVPNVPWLTVSPTSGALPAKISVRANPTGLAAGAHTVVLTFTPAVAVPPGTAGKTNLKLIVAAPAPVLTITPPSVAFANPPVPAPQTVQLKTSGGPVRFSASAGTASWLTVTPKSDVVLSGKPVTLTVTANSNLLGPQVAPYAAKITLTETGSINKSKVIVVLFTMSYQQPTVASIWPPTGRVGGPPTTVTHPRHEFRFSLDRQNSGSAERCARYHLLQLDRDRRRDSGLPTGIRHHTEHPGDESGSGRRFGCNPALHLYPGDRCRGE
jgi:hypothetical protein